MALQIDLQLRQGETYIQVLRWETEPPKFTPITAIPQAAPATITATNHGVPDGWRVAVVSVEGMSEINALHAPPKDSEYHRAYVTDTNTVVLPSINAADFSPYTSGGYLMFYTPVDLVGYTATMDIKDKPAGTVLASFTSDDALSISTSGHSITLTIAAADTASYEWKKGVYNLELVSPDGVVTAVMRGNVLVTKE